MLYYLSLWLEYYWHGFHAFQYLTLRSVCAVLTALLIAFALGPVMIRRLRLYQIGQMVRDDGPQSHLTKSGTPTMGGVLILVAITISTLLWADLANYYVWVVLLVTLSFGVIGFVDDYRKVIRKNSKGLSARQKFLWQSIIAIGAGVFLYSMGHSVTDTQLLIPFFKDAVINLGFFFIPFVFFVIVGSSNAVNLTDGLDGLAALPIVLVGTGLGIFAYVVGNAQFATYLLVPSVPGAGEVTVFCGALAGAGLGFLWYNAYPAEIFMGDVGSLALGAALGIVSVIVHQEIILFIMGGIFVLETVSVIMQVASFKMTGKRIFKMAPIHHHFELKGWPEPKVIVRFWIITVILVLVGLASLKLR